VFGEQPAQFGGLALAADDAGQRQGQREVVTGCLAQLGAELGERGPIVGLQLAHQGRDVTLHRPHRQVEPLGDLPVAQPFGDRPQDVRLAFGHAGSDQPVALPMTVARHAGILRAGCHYGARLGVRIRTSHG
jgi:hypothetical protein